jgi:hypothetical protein
VTAVPPPLDDFADEWINRADLAHLHSLRNQWGQAHVNEDLTSLSWLAVPPFVGGYHSGVLRVDGHVLGAGRLKWAPWGVQREVEDRGIRVLTDTRLAYEANRILWSITVTNESDVTREVQLEQELLAPVAHSEVDWGWLYGTPWNAGHYHDYYATERLRSNVLASEPTEVQLLPHGDRFIRLGSPRLPGIQRDEDSAPMLLESELPDHSTSDSGRVRAPAVLATISGIRASDGTAIAGPFVLDAPHAEFRSETVSLPEGGTLTFVADLARSGQTGVLLTHGNHPDSIQFGLAEGRPWLAIGGERVLGTGELAAGPHLFETRVDEHSAALIVDGVEVARTSPWRGAQRWRASVDGDSLLVIDSASPAVSAFAVAPTPQSLTVDGSRGQADWLLTLAPGESATVGFALAFGTDPAAVLADARDNAAHLTSRIEDVAERWRLLWSNAFLPGNPDHSGYLPVFEAKDPALARTYYFGILLALYMRNTGVSELGPVFLTGGPRLGPTVTYYWDISEWSRTAALLEPVGHRAWLVAALTADYDASHSFDTRNLLPVGNHYASNDHALFRLVQGYVGVTGDTSILDEVAGDRTVLDHLRALAYRPRVKRAAFGNRALVDLGGDAWELLECVPNYRDAVVSFNAGYVGMLRSLAVLLRQLGESGEAQLADLDADELASAVLGQYAGGGRWRISHPGGEDTIGHCLDFELVAADMTRDLDETHRREMVEFVTTHLIDGNWMRALSPDDPIAPLSDRPDHGAAGAFAGWPGSTSYGLCKLGRADLAAEFLARVHLSRSGALWGQAIEAIGDGQYRVAERGVSNRESNAAVAVTETVIGGLFGIAAEYESLEHPTGMLDNEFGRLHGVRAIGFDLATPVRPPIPHGAPAIP